jgi:hypothetical protein
LLAVFDLKIAQSYLKNRLIFLLTLNCEDDFGGSSETISKIEWRREANSDEIE